MLDLSEKEVLDPNVAQLLDDLHDEYTSGEINFIAVVTVRSNGNSTRRLYGSANLATVIGAIEAAKALVLQDMMAECEERPDLLN
jgi:hypothetical protein